MQLETSLCSQKTSRLTCMSPNASWKTCFSIANIELLNFYKSTLFNWGSFNPMKRWLVWEIFLDLWQKRILVIPIKMRNISESLIWSHCWSKITPLWLYIKISRINRELTLMRSLVPIASNWCWHSSTN